MVIFFESFVLSRECDNFAGMPLRYSFAKLIFSIYVRFGSVLLAGNVPRGAISVGI